MIDKNGFRVNVGILLVNQYEQILWVKRVNQLAWQLPQGGVRENEMLEAAVYRELQEEVGLLPKAVKILTQTKNWLHYRIPRKLVRETDPVCIGQKQRWFLLRLIAEEKYIQLDQFETPEFDEWIWVSYWYPLRHVVSFKKGVYRRALRELQPYLYNRVRTISHGIRHKPLHPFLDQVH